MMPPIKMNGVTPIAIKVIFQSRRAETENPMHKTKKASNLIENDSVVNPVSLGT